MCPYDHQDVPQCATVPAAEAAGWLRALMTARCAEGRTWRFGRQPDGIGGNRLTRWPFLKFFIQGSARIVAEDGRVAREARAGDLAYFPAGTYANVDYTGPVTFFRATVLPDLTFIARNEILSAVPGQLERRVERFSGFVIARRPSALTRELLARLERWPEPRAGVEVWPLLCREWLEQVEQGAEGERAEGRARQFEILRYLEDHAHEPINRKAVAAALGLSVGYVSRVFARHGEGGFNATLLRLRLEHAKALLRESGLAVGDIAPRCGFTSANYFAQAFRRAEGVSPAAWRKRAPGRGPGVN